MPKKKYSVKLSENEIKKLTKMTKTGKSSAKEILHANVLLATNDNREPKLTLNFLKLLDAGRNRTSLAKKRFMVCCNPEKYFSHILQL